MLEAGHDQPALQLLNNVFEQCQTYQQALDLLERLRRLPLAYNHNPTAARLYVQTLCRARRPDEILQFFSNHSPEAALWVYQAWALVRLGCYQEALQTLENATPATDMDWSIFYRSKGEALFWTGDPGWLEVFDGSRAHLQGTALGRMLLDRGWFLNHRGQRPAALVSWAEALAYLERDPYYLAWAHHSLGSALLHDQPHKAEQHLLEAYRVSRKEAAREFRARALVGLGAVRRSLGEWERALHSYQRAFKEAGDTQDRLLALWGWGHTLRLMGHVEQAFSKLIQAWELKPEEWLEADLAAVRLMLGEQKSVAESLPRLSGLLQAGKLGERGQMVLRVVEAELSRLQGCEHQARTILTGLSPQSLWVREELLCFPALAKQVGLDIQPTPYRVEVQPFGRLEVRVNGRRVPIAAISKAGELLVFLLVNGNKASLELLLDRLSDPANKNPRKALWETIEKLRRALGWKDSVQSCGGVYTLDPRAEWVCDLEPQSYPFPGAEDPSQTFMAGYYSEWVEEWRQQWLVV
ncbi:hypothetical protein MHY01S_18270 [Meiothermus hypogaeus NBRC 106114]|uniref:Uncharacterized protein n=3 Tax=Meiothermus hypogaeus TaxID=884155 RepID=A0A511R225_9DEIN|nr:Tetratricopeptide repeat protein [Meiothermus hypogaeus]GEM83661.1 hypothetical protein MHY01S_18270 [Meiothermus hypogaeus NBRC 106114]